MKRIATKILIICLLFSLAGCSQTGASVSEKQSDKMSDRVKNNAISIGNVFEANSFLNGTMNYTISNAHIVANIYDEGLKLKDLDEYSVVTNNGVDYQYPEYIDSTTGKLIDGCTFVMLEITAENVNANNTHKLEYNNPYLFRADGIVSLVDITNPVDSDHFNYYNIVYFSRQNKFIEHKYAYELKPGEKTSFKIGFVVGMQKENETYNYSNLYACNSSGNPDSTFINLALA